VTPSTFRAYISADGELRRELRSDSVLHDLDLVDVAYHLKRSGKVRAYYPENLIASGFFTGGGHGAAGLNLRPFAEVNSDAAVDMTFNAGTYVFAVEYEASLKAKLRYKALFDAYLAATGVPIVLYVCRDGELLARLLAYETEFAADSVAKFFYATLSDLKEMMVPTFTNRRGEVLRLAAALAA
jgi:hypothetical protein